MLYGGKDSAVTLDHYAEVLFDLEEYSLAFVYWAQALSWPLMTSRSGARVNS